MARFRVFYLGNYQYGSIYTGFNLFFDDYVSDGRHLVNWSIVTVQTPAGSGYQRTVRNGTLTIDNNVTSIGEKTVYNDLELANGSVYTDKDTFSVYLSINVGGTIKEISTTVTLEPINKPIFVKEGNYVEYIPYEKETNYSEVAFMVKENGSWGEY